MVVRMQPAQLFIHASSLATSHFPFPISASHTRSCYTDLRCNTFTPEFSHQHVQRQRAPTDARRNPPGRSRACVRRQRRPPKNPHRPSRRQPLHGCRHPPLPFLRKPRIRPRHTLPKSASGFLLTRRQVSYHRSATTNLDGTNRSTFHMAFTNCSDTRLASAHQSYIDRETASFFP